MNRATSPNLGRETRRIIGENGRQVLQNRTFVEWNQVDERLLHNDFVIVQNVTLCNAIDQISLACARTKNRIIHRSRTRF